MTQPTTVLFESLLICRNQKIIMKSNTIVTLLTLGAVVVVGLFILGYISKGGTAASVQGVTDSTVALGQISATETIYDFGNISMKNGDVTKDFSFANLTEQDIKLRTVETSCMCTAAFLVRLDGSKDGPFGMASMGAPTKTSDLIKAGETGTLRVVYNPNAHGPAGIGRIDRFITITDASNRSLRFEIKANVTP